MAVLIIAIVIASMYEIHTNDIQYYYHTRKNNRSNTETKVRSNLKNNQLIKLENV